MKTNTIIHNTVIKQTFFQYITGRTSGANSVRV